MRPAIDLSARAPIALAALALAWTVSATAAAAASPVQIEGVEDDETRDAMRAALPDRPKPETLFDAERIAEEAAARLSEWLRSEGYYAGAARPSATDDPPRARVRIDFGRRFAFASPTLTLDTDESAPTTAARAAIAQHVAPGRPARAADVLAAEQAALDALRTAGFAEAAIGPRQAIVDHATGEMRVAFAAALGAPVRLGRLRTQPPDLVRQSFLDKLPTWRPGDSYTPEHVASVRRALVSTGAFARVDAALAPPAEGESAATRDVLVRLEASEPRTIALGASWSSTEGGGVDAEWDYRNALKRAETFSLGLRVADREQRLSAGLFLPHDVGLGRARRYTAELVREEARPYDRVGALVGVAVEAQRTVRSALTYGATLSADAYDATAGIDNAIVLSTFAGLRRDTTNDRFDPRHGAILDGRIEPAVSTGSATVAFARATGEARAFLTPERDDGRDGRFTYAARLRAGWVQPIAGDAADLPLDRRFYAGGGGSVRGYAFQSIFPQDLLARDDPPGGQGLLESSAEVRARFGGGWGAAAFVDGGSAFNAADELGDIRWGAGIGLRYDLGFGPLRLDVAAPLNKRTRDKAVAFYVSFGQAF